MYYFWTQLYAQFQFLKKLKDIILEADYMKKDYPVNRTGLHTTSNDILVLQETLTFAVRG